MAQCEQRDVCMTVFLYHSFRRLTDTNEDSFIPQSLQVRPPTILGCLCICVLHP